MNIFVLDLDPTKAALYHCDKHVVNMLRETAQMLSTTHRLMSSTDDSFPFIYRTTHVNHPCNIWLRESVENYLWLLELYEELEYQYNERYNRSHASYKLLYQYLKQVPDMLPVKGLTPFTQAMPEQYKDSLDPVKAYRNYYLGDKLRFCRWTSPATTPYWVEEYLNIKPHEQEKHHDHNPS